MDTKDRAELKKAESWIEEGKRIKRRVFGRLRARAYRRSKREQENIEANMGAKARKS